MANRTALRKLALLLLALCLTACFENNSSTKFGTGSNLNIGGTGTSQTSSVNTMVIANVTITGSTSSSSTSPTYTTTVFFDPVKSQSQISSFCSSQSGSTSTTTGNVCVCNYTWNEVNTTSGNSVPILRSVQTPVQFINGDSATCAAPPTYSSILPGTSISVSVLPGSGNGYTFPMSPYSYNSTTSSGSADFQDAQGNSYQNILRYSCYQQFQRGMSITSQLQTLSNSSTGAQVSAPMATQFCVQNASSSSSSSSTCPGGSVIDYTSQAYYYNLYIRDSEQGDINLANKNYHCPQIKEALGNNGSVGTQNKVWPLDRTFALSLGPTVQYPIGVEAYTELSDGSTDPTAQNKSCYPSASASTTPTSGSSSSGNGNTLVSGCLGFAAQPNPDGTCPYFRDTNNNIRFTYRLRRYYAIYPPLFDTNGLPLSGQGSDTIYVLDRPVNSPNPLQPYTMAGPKPCLFSFYDRAAVTGVTDSNYQAFSYSRPGYVASNNSSWSGKNVDGLQLPNTDSATSCAATVGLVNSAKTAMSLGTVNASNPGVLSLTSGLTINLKNVYIRPTQPWAPHYIEDKSFLACAPQASPLIDPPLHIAKDPVTGNVGWCAEVYPTQNPNVAAIDPYNPALDTWAFGGATYSGDVSPFTSHVVKNSSSGTCAPTYPALPTGYPAASVCEPNLAPYTFTGTTTAGSANVVGLGGTTVTALAVGQNITGAGIPANTTIASLTLSPGTSTATALTLSQNATGASPALRIANICAADHPANLIVDSGAGAGGGANKTCDRTVNSLPQDWLKFPLLAPAADTEKAIANDISSYGCMITYDNGGSKTGKASPSTGCCLAPSSTVTTGVGGATAAHIEPTISCLTPTY